MRRTSGTIAVLLFVAAGVAWAASGDLDANFDGDGVVTESFNGSLDALAVQSDGKIVALDGRRLRRYGTDGSVDSTFRTSTPADFVLDTTETSGDTETRTWYAPRGMLVDANDEIFLIGYTVTETTTTTTKGKSGKTETTTSQTDPVLFVAKLDADGDAVTTFGADGVATLDVSGSDDDQGTQIAMQSDGSIVVAGHAMAESATSGGGGNGKGNGKGGGGGTTTSRAILLARFTSSGSLDTTFGADAGYTVHDRTSGADAPPEDSGTLIGIQSNDDIVVGSASDSDDWVITRYDSDGTLDSAFGAITKSGHQLESLAIQSDDAIVAVGTDFSGSDLSDQRAVVVRYGANGAADTSFGTSGSAALGISGRSLGRAVAVDGSGNLLVAALDAYQVSGAWVADAVLVRLDSDGDLDTSFGTGGTAEAVQTKDVNQVHHLAVDGSGRIVGGGSYTDAGFIGPLLARWLGS